MTLNFWISCLYLLSAGFRSKLFDVLGHAFKHSTYKATFPTLNKLLKLQTPGSEGGDDPRPLPIHSGPIVKNKKMPKQNE